MKGLADTPFDLNLKLASFDISNMYTSITTKELLKIMDIMCVRHNIYDTLEHIILRISKLLVTQNCFKFRDTTYLQEKGLAIGAPTSSIFSETYLQYIEKTIIFDILRSSKVEGYFRHVDEILIGYKEKHTDIEEILNVSRTGLLNCLNALSRGLTFRHRASCI